MLKNGQSVRNLAFDTVWVTSLVDLVQPNTLWNCTNGGEITQGCFQLGGLMCDVPLDASCVPSTNMPFTDLTVDSLNVANMMCLGGPLDASQCLGQRVVPSYNFQGAPVVASQPMPMMPSRVHVTFPGLATFNPPPSLITRVRRNVQTAPGGAIDWSTGTVAGYETGAPGLTTTFVASATGRYDFHVSCTFLTPASMSIVYTFGATLAQPGTLSLTSIFAATAGDAAVITINSGTLDPTKTCTVHWFFFSINNN